MTQLSLIQSLSILDASSSFSSGPNIILMKISSQAKEVDGWTYAPPVTHHRRYQDVLIHFYHRSASIGFHSSANSDVITYQTYNFPESSLMDESLLIFGNIRSGFSKRCFNSIQLASVLNISLLSPVQAFVVAAHHLNQHIQTRKGKGRTSIYTCKYLQNNI